MKGGTSLSKGFGVIHRLSEDIDIRIEPPDGMNVKTGLDQDKPAHIASRRAYYDALAARIKIPGIDDVVRDTLFDDDKMRSADAARDRGVDVFDNPAVNVPCYAPTHTFVEKLQIISTKYRRLSEAREFLGNFLRQYYVVHCLWGLYEVREFLARTDYHQHKERRFARATSIRRARVEPMVPKPVVRRAKIDLILCLPKDTINLIRKRGPECCTLIESPKNPR